MKIIKSNRLKVKHMDTNTIDSKVEGISITDRVKHAFGTLKRYTTLALTGTAIALAPAALQGCVDEETSDCCSEMYDRGQCDYDWPSGCEGYGTKCVDHSDGTCSCDSIYKNYCK